MKNGPYKIPNSFAYPYLPDKQIVFLIVKSPKLPQKRRGSLLPPPSVIPKIDMQNIF